MSKLFFNMYVCFSIYVTQLNVWRLSGTLILPWICKTSITYDIATFPIIILPCIINISNYTTIYYWKQLVNKQEMKHSRFMKWDNRIN